MLTRCFVVGCPRSGTTYIQGILSATEAVFSLPETHFFDDFNDGVIDALRRHTYSHRRRRPPRSVAVDVLELRSDPRAQSRRWQDAGVIFQERLDHLAAEAGASAWVEKTPGHFRAVRVIERVISEPKIIHVVRNPIHVVASLMEVTRRHPEPWGGPRSAESCVREYNSAIRAARRAYRKTNHLVVRYEAAVRDPRQVAAHMFRFLGLSSNDIVLPSEETLSTLIRHSEPWKANNLSRNYVPEDKTAVMSREEQTYVRSHVADLAWLSSAS